MSESKKPLQIMVIGEAGAGKTAIATLIASELARLGLDVFHVPNPDGPVPLDSIPGRLNAVIEKKTPIIVNEVQTSRLETIIDMPEQLG